MALTKISTAMWNSVPHHDTHDFNVDNVLYVDVSANRVGIGTTSPTVKLEINPSSGDADLILSSNGTQTLRLDQNSIRTTTTNNLTLFTNGNSNQLMLHSGGNVGIGTNNPTNGKLQIDSTTNQISIETGTAGNGRLHIGHFSNGTFIGTYGDDGGVADVIRFGTHSGDERMRITSGGTIEIPNQNAINEIQFTGSQYTNIYSQSTAGFDIGTNSVSGTSYLRLLTEGVERMRINSSGNVTATVDMRAPIFYDSNDTNYYVDPAANSKLKYIASGDAGVLASGYSITAYDSKRYLIGLRNSSATGANYPWLVHDDVSGGDGLVVHFNGLGDRMTLNELGSLTATGDMRAPIFYDSDNTGYYINPASTSTLSSLDIKSVQRWYRSGNNAHQRVDARLDGTDQARMHWYGKNDADSTVNFKHAWYDGGSYINVTAASDFVYFQETSGTVSVQADGSMRAPIFYDSNDTSYYINPNGGSNVKANFTIQDNGSSSPLLDIQADDAGPWAIRLYRDDLGTGPQVYASNANEWYFNHTVAAGTTIRANGDARAPIFYDSDNTGYYVDPASTSSVVNIAMGGELRLHSHGSTKFYIGSGDAANYTNQNVVLAGWNGLGLYNPTTGGAFANQTSGFYDFRNGIFDVKGSFRAPIFYDSNNTGYYLDGSSTSYLHSLTLAGGAYFRPQNWIQLDSSYGLYWPNHYGAHFEANILSSYGQLAMRGSKNNYSGIYDLFSGVNGIMYDSSGNGGVYREANGRWFWYHNLSNDCMGIGTSTTNSAFNLYMNKGARMGGRADANIFYDGNNTAYYMDYYGGGALRGNFEFAANSTSTSYQYASIELRESNFTANGTATPPFISFHWGGVVASSIAIESSGRIAIKNNPGTGYENFIAATISATGDVIAYSSSDERLKDNQKNIDNALEKVESLNGIEFDWNDKQDTFTGHDVGVIAQEVEKVLPEIVNTRDTGYKAVKYEKLVPLLIEAIKELSEKVKILENK